LTRHAALNLACLLEVGQQAKCTISKILLIKDSNQAQVQPSSFGDRYCLSVKSRKLSVATVSVWVHLEQETPSIFFYELLNARNKKLSPYEQCTRTKYQRFVNKALRSAFKKRIISMPTLLQGLHMMSLTKSVPNGLKPRKCKCMSRRLSPTFPKKTRSKTKLQG
jgi:hypothetical protein